MRTTSLRAYGEAAKKERAGQAEDGSAATRRREMSKAKTAAPFAPPSSFLTTHSDREPSSKLERLSSGSTRCRSSQLANASMSFFPPPYQPTAGASTPQNGTDGQSLTHPAMSGSPSDDSTQANTHVTFPSLFAPLFPAPAGTPGSAPVAILHSSSRLAPGDQPEANNEPTLSQPLAAPSSASSSSSSSGTTSDDDDDFTPEKNSARRKNSSSGTVSSLTAGGRAATSGQFWCEEEDSILRSCIRAHGTDWSSAAESFNRESDTKRTAGALEKRWSRLLHKGKKGATQRQQASRPSISSSNPHAAQRQQAPRPSASSSAYAVQPWSGEETTTLQRIFFQQQRAGSPISYDEVFEDFMAACPTSTRSRDAVRRKCSTFSSNANTTNSSAQASVRRAAAAAGRNDEEEQPPAATLSSSSAAQASQAPTSHAAQASFRHQPHPEAHHQAAINASQDIDVDVAHAPGGVTVRCPRGFEVRVYSPSHVKVRRAATPTALNEEAEAAFYLMVLDDGSIRPLRLPTNTTASAATVTSGNDGVTSEIRWTEPGGYWVCVRAAP